MCVCMINVKQTTININTYTQTGYDAYTFIYEYLHIKAIKNASPFLIAILNLPYESSNVCKGWKLFLKMQWKEDR